MEDPGSSDEEINQEKPEHHLDNIRVHSPLSKNKPTTGPLCSRNNVPTDVAVRKTSRNDDVNGNCKNTVAPSEEPLVVEGSVPSQLEHDENKVCGPEVRSLENAILDVCNDVSLEQHSASVCTDVALPALHKNISCDAVTSDIARENSDRGANAKTGHGRTDSSSGVNLLKDIFNFFQGDSKHAVDPLGSHMVTVGTTSSKNDTKSPSPNNAIEPNSCIELTNQTSVQDDSQNIYPSAISISSSIPVDSATDVNFTLREKHNSPEANECKTDTIPDKGSDEAGSTSGQTNGFEDPVFQEKTVTLDGVDKETASATSSFSENPAEDALLAELENEFFSTTDIRMSVSNSVECFPEYNALNSKFNALQARLEHTLSQRKELEVENARLEQKLAAAIKHTDAVKLELESVISAHETEADNLKQRIVSLEEKSKQELLDLQNEHRLRVELLTKQYEDSVREKDGVVVRYAQAEQKNIDVQDKLQKAEARVKEWTKEREIALVKWHTMKADIKKSTELNQTLASEVTSLRKEVEKQKELASSADVKVKWQQNKIKAEQDTNKETKAKLQEAEDKLKEIRKEELLTIDQIKSIFLILQELDDGKVPVEMLQKRELCNFDEILPIVRKGLRMLEMKERELVAELQTFRDKVRCLEVERLSQEESLNSVRDSLFSQQQSNMDLRDRILQLEKAERNLHSCEKRLKELEAKVEELELTCHDQAAEIAQLTKRESDQLTFTSRISEKNTLLLADSSKLTSEVSALNSHLEEMSSRCRELECQNRKLEEELHSQTIKATDEARNLESERLKLSEVRLKLDETEDEMKTLKRRHASNMKDLTRQLQLASRRIAEGKESGIPTGKNERDNASLGSLGSQGGSCGSLDTAGIMAAGNSEPSVQSEEGRIEEHSRELLLEKITSLEKTIRRKCEKIDFLKDHVDQLIEELHRKSRIIQGYVLREETGALVPESSDKNKAQLAKKGGVMASLYASHALDGSMTMGLSLEINRKLQALLEDTLLKNIKLKEGMDTLGQEIDWLSRENKRLQQELERTAGQSGS